MYYDIDKFEHTPDLRDPVTGDWVPFSESDKARLIRAEERRKMSNTDISSMISAIFK